MREAYPRYTVEEHPLARPRHPAGCFGWAVVCLSFLAPLGPVRAEERLLYGFERPDHGWMVGGSKELKSHASGLPRGASAGIKRAAAPEGTAALLLEAAFPGELWTYVQPDANWSAYDHILLDVYLPPHAPKWIQLLAVIRDRDLWWYQAIPLIWLKPGKWQTVELHIAPSSVEWKAQDHMKAWDGYATQRVRLFGVRFFSHAAFRGAILVDNVRAICRTPVRRKRFFQHFSTNADEVGLYEKFEVTFCLARAYSNPFDPQVVQVLGYFTAPSGRTVSVPGFFYQDYQRQKRQGGDYLIPTGGRKWKIRFAPTELGRYDFWVEVRDDRVTRTRIRSFSVVPSQDPGFVRVSQADWHYFEFANGDFYYPIGHNMHAPYDRMYGGFRHTSLSPAAGLENYERVFPKMAANSENFVEVWMAAWWLALEWNPKHNFFHGLGRYNLQNAWKLDYLFDLAQQHGMYIHLVVQNHGTLSLWCDTEWADNPYNAALGGFLSSPEEFFASQKAIECFQKKMDYIMARWGYSTRLFGIELVSELDLTGENWSFVNSRVKIAWHDKVANHVKQIDPNNHLVTTHYSSGYYREDPALVGQPYIDYTVTDGYRADRAQHKDIVQVVNDTWQFNAQFKKPTFITEYGGRNAVESSHVLEMDLHCGIWASYVSPTGATPLFWWFHFIDDRDQYSQYKALAAFHGGLDRRGLDLRPAAATFERDAGLLKAQCLVGPTAAILWIYDRGLPREKREFTRVRGAKVRFTGLSSGQYHVEFWNTYTGRIVKEQRLEVENGTAVLPLPEFTKDIACKVLCPSLAARQAETRPEAAGRAHQSVEKPPLSPRAEP